MDVQSKLEKEWHRYPCIRKAIKDPDRMPEHLYNDWTSYNTLLDDVHDWLMIAAVVANAGDAIAGDYNIESIRDLERSAARLHDEFRELQSKLSCAKDIVKQIQAQLRESECRLSNDINAIIRARIHSSPPPGRGRGKTLMKLP